MNSSTACVSPCQSPIPYSSKIRIPPLDNLGQSCSNAIFVGLYRSTSKWFNENLNPGLDLTKAGIVFSISPSIISTGVDVPTSAIRRLSHKTSNVGPINRISSPASYSVLETSAFASRSSVGAMAPDTGTPKCWNFGLPKS